MFKSQRRLSTVRAAMAIAGLCGAQVGAAVADELDDYVRSEIEARKIPGLSFAVVKDGRVVDQRSYGLANIETGKAAGPDTVYAVGSITKSMTAIVVMKLVESGAVSLDDQIGAHIEGLPKRWRKLTIRQLLSNTSGIPDDLDNPCRYQGPPTAPGFPAYSVRDALAEVACLPLASPPGEKFLYANHNYLLLGLLVEARTGDTFAAVLREMIFDPLGMTRTTTLDYRAVVIDRADGYEWVDGEYRNSEPMDAAVEFSAGNVLAPIGEMAVFVLAMGDRKLLADESWRMLWTAPEELSSPSPYGLGFGLTPFEGRMRIGHNGSAVGFSSSFSYFPDERAGVVVLANGYQEPLGRNVQDLAHAIASKSGVLGE